MDILSYVAAVGIGTLAFYLTKLLVIVGAIAALPMLVVGIWQGGPRFARRVWVGLGASMQSLCCGIPALYLTVRYSSGSVPTLGCYLLMAIFMLLWLVRLGFERFMLHVEATSPIKGDETIDETRLLAGAVLWSVAAGLVVIPLLFPRFRPTTAGPLMPVLYLAPFLLGWFYFSGEWLLSGLAAEPVAESETG